MPWGRLDDSLYDHPKLEALPRDEDAVRAILATIPPDALLRLVAIGLWTRSISWSNRFLTDGSLPRGRVAKLDGSTALADAMVAAGLLDVSPQGYAIHDFLDFNESRVDIEERRRKEAAKKAAQRAAKRTSAGRRRPPKVRPPGSPPGTSSVSDANVPEGVPPGHVPEGHATDVESVPPGPPAGAPARANPVPSRPSDSPQPPQAGARSRANGTNPRAVAQAEREQAVVEAKHHRERRSQRQLAYLRGSLTEDQRRDMDGRDAPLTEIPDYEEHRARLLEEQEADAPLAQWTP